MNAMWFIETYTQTLDSHLHFAYFSDPLKLIRISPGLSLFHCQLQKSCIKRQIHPGELCEMAASGMCKILRPPDSI